MRVLSDFGVDATVLSGGSSIKLGNLPEECIWHFIDTLRSFQIVHCEFCIHQPYDRAEFLLERNLNPSCARRQIRSTVAALYVSFNNDASDGRLRRTSKLQGTARSR